MTHIDFNVLSDMEKLQVLLEALHQAMPNEIFDGANDAKEVYRKISKHVHPDVIPGDEDDENAQDAFSRLNDLYEAYNTGDTSGVTIGADRDFDIEFETGNAKYTGAAHLRDSSVYAEYLIRDNARMPYVLRIPHSAKDNDLMKNEQRILENFNSEVVSLIQSGQVDNSWNGYLPYLSDTVKINGKMCSVLSYDMELWPEPQRMFTLREIAEAFEHQIDIRHLGWLWRRVLITLNQCQVLGYVNNSITPDDILVDVEDHGVIINNWTHASRHQDFLASYSMQWKDIYPPEVFNKQTPTAALDVYMAASSMRWAWSRTLEEADNEPINRYFSANFILDHDAASRTSDVGTLDNYWKIVIYDQMQWPREFVVLDIPLTYGSNFDWSIFY